MLTSKHLKTVEVPGEPGEWVKVRMPSLGIIQETQRGLPGDVLDPDMRSAFAIIPMLQACVLEWSYPEPVTPENVADLDAGTAAALVSALMAGPDEVERKNSSRRSTKP